MSATPPATRGALACWTALPEWPLEAAGAATGALCGAGCETFREAGRLLCELPYGRNRDRADWRSVLPEGHGTCSTKHALLAAGARELGREARLVIGVYDMTERNTPGVGAVLAGHGLDRIPEAHCYLRVGDQRVDVTRAGASPVEPIRSFHVEWIIEPEQIGDHKVSLHRSWLAQWLAEPGAPALDLDRLWAIREACIHALSQAAS